ncbi:PDZ domain-containing protein [bacterium]|nr:PDZ domain-containing protein [candidate division CSSED10-310 bacterium]
MNVSSIPGLVFCLWISFMTFPADAFDSWNDQVVSIIQKARLCVVNIEARSPISSRLGPLGEVIAARQRGSGAIWYKALASGVIWDKQGHIVTTASVVRDAESFIVHFGDDKQALAKLVGQDFESNLAVLKCESDGEYSLSTLPKRPDELPEGSWIALLGYGFGGVPTVSSGLAGIPPQQFDPARLWFQFTAPVRAGNSGSALVDSQGQLAGIVLGKEEETGFQAILKQLTQQSQPPDAIHSSQAASCLSNSGVAIPINKASDIIDQLITKGEVTRGWIGVAVQGSSCPVSDQPVCLQVVRLVPGSPADLAGLHLGDCLVNLNNHPLQTPSELGHLVATAPLGEIVQIKFYRGTEEHEASVQITARPVPTSMDTGPADRIQSIDPDSLGIRLQDLTESLRRHFRVPETSGIIVSEIREDSPFLATGLEVGDVLVSLEGYPLKSTDDFRRILMGKHRGDAIRLTVYRGGAERIVTLKLN